MKQLANKSLFGLKWLAVLIATLLFVGTFAHVSTVNAETDKSDTSTMTILGNYEQKIDFVEGEDYNATVTVKLQFNKPEYPEIKVPVQIKNLPTGKGGIRLFVYRDKDNNLLLQAFVETAKDHSVINYQMIPIEDGKVTKPFQYTASDKERTRFLEELASAEDEDEEEEEATTSAKSNAKSSNANNSNSSNSNVKGSENKDIFDKIDDFFDQIDSEKIGEGFGKQYSTLPLFS